MTLASSYGALPDDGDYTETCWRIFNVNFNTPFKAFSCVSVGNKTLIIPLLISITGSRACQTHAADRHSEFVNNESRPLGTQANEMHITGKIREMT